MEQKTSALLQSKQVLTRTTLLIMAFATGATVANLYYNQPLLDQIRESFGASVEQVGWIPSLTQAGYALGMLFLVPLGDMLDRKKLVLLFTFFSALVSAWFALSSRLPMAVLASLLLGICTMTPQLLIPFAAHLAEPKERGKVIGTMFSGLLLGILLARTVSGFVGAAFGWRAMFGGAAVFLFLLTLILAIILPKSKPSYHGAYLGLLKSVIQIFREQPVLREASFFGAMLFGSFSIFWATLIHLMETPDFNLGARAVGLFGLLGAAAALLSPVVGGLADRHDARRTTGIMIGLTIFSFVVFSISGHSLIGIAVGVLLMDIGVQSGHISNQGRIFALLPEAQSRIQTAYMFFYFIGGALGSILGAFSWSHYHWLGVCAAAILMLILALGKFLIPVSRSAV